MPHRGLFRATVIANTPLCTEHYRLTLHVPDFPDSDPGQFVQLECRDPAAAQTEAIHIPSAAAPLAAPRILEWPPAPGNTVQLLDPDLRAPSAYLRRPFSIAGVPAPQQIDIIHRVVGRGTRFLETLSPGDESSVLGPLGHGFTLPESMTCALLVGGGVGIPPMLFLADRLARRGKKAIAFVGAQRKNLIPLAISPIHPPTATGEPALCVQDFARHGFPTVLTTDDGSLGMKGFVTQGLDQFLTNADRAGLVIFCCGPTPMMKATAKVAAKHQVRCFVSLEQPMACGMGTCQSCVVKVKTPTDWVYKLTCTDGPVFETNLLLW